MWVVLLRRNIHCQKKMNGMKNTQDQLNLIIGTRVIEGTLYPFVSITDYSTTSSYVSQSTGLLSNETQQISTHSKNKEIARLLNLVIRPVLIVFGTIGNGLSCYIMRQGPLKKMPTCLYLSIIALADTSRCVMFLFDEWLMNFKTNLRRINGIDGYHVLDVCQL